jgi:hypothetical protein
MFQGSVGAKPATWTPGRAAPFLISLRKAWQKNGKQVWSNVESFEIQGTNWVPCSFDRFDEQLRATQGNPAEDLRVTFEFFHYLNGSVLLERWKAVPGYAERMKSLYDTYKNKYINMLQLPAVLRQDRLSPLGTKVDLQKP